MLLWQLKAMATKMSEFDTSYEPEMASGSVQSQSKYDIYY